MRNMKHLAQRVKEEKRRHLLPKLFEEMNFLFSHKDFGRHPKDWDCTYSTIELLMNIDEKVNFVPATPDEYLDAVDKVQIFLENFGFPAIPLSGSLAR